MKEQSMEQKEIKKPFEDLAIYTATFYGKDEVSRVREKLALKLFDNADQLGIRCVVSDGGSNEDFLKEVKNFSNVDVIRESSKLSIGESRRGALKTAMEQSEAPFFFWIEPEKDDLVTKENLENMIAALRNNRADIVVPRRENKETMPKFQAWIEDRANKRAMDTAGVSLDEAKEVWDLWFGPKMFNREGTKYFVDYKGKLDKWDSIIKPVLNAYRDGKRIVSVGVDYKYDITQKESEEGDDAMKRKRIFQYVKILAELGDEFWQQKEEK